jgi:O-antigen ligase
VLGGLAAVVLAISLTAFVAIEQFPLGGLWDELTIQHATRLSSSSAHRLRGWLLVLVRTLCRAGPHHWVWQ